MSFKGKESCINTRKKLRCFERIFVSDGYSDGDGYFGKEGHVWMSLDGFEGCRMGNRLAFEAEIYRYLKTGHGRMIDLGLWNPTDVRKSESYELPSDDLLRLQAVDVIIYGDLCMYKEHCYGFCIANEVRRDKNRYMHIRWSKMTYLTEKQHIENEDSLLEILVKGNS